ncbi:hypothetical protein BDW22DRAFT_1323410 [Trametopsis cervina]|nr:hypothetical protein BDW22DRAFT_1323410 [Trametopsis cervina]
MATVTHYIRSHYDPKDREALEIETGQIPSHSESEEQADEEDPWQTESTFGAQRRLAAAPRFVPATVSYDEVNNMLGGIPRIALQPPAEEPRSEVSSWYRSLTSRSNHLQTSDTSSSSITTTRQPEESATPRPYTAPQSTARSSSHSRPDKKNWFISRALQSEPPSISSTPPPTLADILDREPPVPKQPVKPPVFLALGPTNKGWSMLQRSGWNEGEGLGATVARQIAQQPVASSSRFMLDSEESRGEITVKTEQREVRLDEAGEITELREVEIVDLTLSDPEDEIEEIEAPDTGLRTKPDISSSAALSTREASPHSTPLLTPIPTILKSDRLGIGLKAKTVGPYKASKKRVTHNQAALAAHIRSNEETKRMKTVVGRGTRSFARLAKADSEQRRQLLASLNEG